MGHLPEDLPEDNGLDVLSTSSQGGASEPLANQPTVGPPVPPRPVRGSPSLEDLIALVQFR